MIPNPVVIGLSKPTLVNGGALADEACLSSVIDENRLLTTGLGITRSFRRSIHSTGVLEIIN